MNPFRPLQSRSLRAGLSVPLVALLFGGVGLTQSAPPPSGPGEVQVASPPLEEPAAPQAPAVPDQAANAGQASPMSGGVAGGVVVVRNLPSGPFPGAADAPRREHIQGEFLQEQGVEPGGVAAPAMRKETPFAPQAPPMAPEANAPDGFLPSAPGNSVEQFTALSNTGWIPPDTIHAVGPSHVVEAVNSGFAIYTKFGTQVQGYTTFDSFLNKPVPWNGFMFDPRIVYDATHAKFVMLVLGRDDTAVRSYFWLAVSQTSDPTAGWWIWRFDATNGTGGSTAWLDYAGVAADSWGVYVTGNYFFFSGGFRGSNIWSINPDIFNGGATNGWQFVDLRWPSNAQAFAIQPAQPHSVNANATTFFVNTFSGSGSQVLLWKMTGDRTNAPGLTRVAINTAGYEALGMQVDQPGSATDIDAGDARVMNAVYSQSHVFYVLTDDVNNDGTDGGWLTVKLNVNTNTNAWEDLIWTNNYYYFYPAITILGGSSASANLAIFGSWASPEAAGNQFASGLFKIYDNQPAANTGPFISHTGGLAAYVALDSSGRNRWGDYSGAGYDWQCGYAWGSVEAADTGNDWRTVINAVNFGAEAICPQIEVSVPNGGQVWNAGTNHLISWQRRGLTATNDVYIFFETGTSTIQIAGPLAASASSFNWLVNGVPTTTGRIFVGSWNGSAYEATDRSDANFTVTAPNLRVINPSVSANLMLPGAAFTANATANNNGNGSSNVSTTLRYYRSTDSTITTADTQLATDPIGALGAGSSSAQNAALTAPAADGNYWIGACVDAVAGESSTTDQCSAGVQITVARPDLTITSIDAPPTANPGSNIVVANSVRNQGTIGTGVGFRVGIYYSADAACNAADTLIGSRVVGALGAGITSSANSNVTIPAAAVPGARTICAVADDLAAVAENNEANNIGTDNITIVALIPTVNLKVNGIDAVLPAGVATTGLVNLTLDMTPGGTPLTHYWGIFVGGTLVWVTPSGTSTTPAPIGTFTPVAATNVPLLSVPNWPAGTSLFLWLMYDGATLVGQDVILVNVTP